MLDRNSRISVPDESYFVPQLVHRHRRSVEPDAFLDDLRRLPTLREWGLPLDDVAARLRPGMSTGEAIGAVFEAYAAQHGKSRWGDKTPMYMQYLPLLERLFPTARFVHLVRDGRDAALSFLSMPAGIMTEGWGHPRDAEGFACQWRTEVAAALALGRRVGPERYLELRYEDLVARPEDALQRICAFAGLPYEPGCSATSARSTSPASPTSSASPSPPPWACGTGAPACPSRTSARSRPSPATCSRGSATRFEPAPRGRAGARLRLGSYRAVTAAWRGAGYVLQRSPQWRRRHPPLV